MISSSAQRPPTNARLRGFSPARGSHDDRAPRPDARLVPRDAPGLDPKHQYRQGSTYLDGALSRMHVH